MDEDIQSLDSIVTNFEQVYIAFIKENFTHEQSMQAVNKILATSIKAEKQKHGQKTNVDAIDQAAVNVLVTIIKAKIDSVSENIRTDNDFIDRCEPPHTHRMAAKRARDIYSYVESFGSDKHKAMSAVLAAISPNGTPSG